LGPKIWRPYAMGLDAPALGRPCVSLTRYFGSSTCLERRVWEYFDN